VPCYRVSTTSEQGNCIVHHMFGAEVVERVKSRARRSPTSPPTSRSPARCSRSPSRPSKREPGRGGQHLGHPPDTSPGRFEGSARPRPGAGHLHLSVVLGTESGMITSDRAARSSGACVAQQRPARRPSRSCSRSRPRALCLQTGDARTRGWSPGVAGGEGCSHRRRLRDLPLHEDELARRVDDGPGAHADASGADGPRSSHLSRGDRGVRRVAQLGELPIRHMRDFQRTGHLPPALVADMRSRAASQG
jgi:quinolinate synthase